MQSKLVSKQRSQQMFFASSPLALLLSACGGGGGSTTYSISAVNTVPPGNNSFLNATTQGSYWAPTDGVLTFAVSGGLAGEEWAQPDVVQTQFTAAMAQLSYFTDLGVRDLGLFTSPITAADEGATVVFGLDDDNIFAGSGSNVWAVGYFPDYDESGYDTVSGDIFLNLNSDGAALSAAAYEPGGAGFTLILHEIGHAVGLKHPHDDGGEGRPTYAEIDMGDMDDQLFTVMAYEDVFGDTLNAPGTFMVVDALALMSLYGVNETTNTGDTTHVILDTDVRNTLWDAGGTDTVDVSATNNDVELWLSYRQLNPDLNIEYGHVETLSDTGEARLHWLLGEYENATTGAGDDFLNGDENANTLTGGAGDDILDGWDGDDTLYGGSGADLFYKGVGEGNDVIADFEVGVDRCVFFDANNVVDANIATLSSTAEGGALYTLTDGSTLTLLDVSAALV